MHPGDAYFVRICRLHDRRKSAPSSASVGSMHKSLGDTRLRGRLRLTGVRDRSFAAATVIVACAAAAS